MTAIQGRNKADDDRGITGGLLLETKKYKLYITILYDYEIVEEADLPASLTDEEIDKKLDEYTDRLIDELQIINFTYDEIKEEE